MGATARASTPLGRGSRRGLRVAERDDIVMRLSGLVGAGLTVARAIDIVERDASSTVQRRRLDVLARDVAAGLPLARALVAPPAIAGREVAALVAAGESSGSLATNLRLSVELLIEARARRRRLRAAVAYPLVVVVLALAMVLVVLITVLPRFVSFYATLDGDLPALTLAVVRVGRVVTSGAVGPTALAVVVLVVAIVRRSGRSAARERLAASLDRLPVLGRIRVDAASVVALRVLGGLLAGRVPLLEALGIAEGAATSARVRAHLGGVRAAVASGASLRAALSRDAVLSVATVAVITVGEETGDLAAAVQRAATTLAERTEERATLLATALEPVLIGLAGVVVGSVVLALYLPIFGIADLIR